MRSQTVVDTPTTITEITCDVCGYTSTTGRFYQCFGCGKDVCWTHMAYVDDVFDLTGDYGYKVCPDCLKSYEVLFTECKDKLDKVHAEVDQRIEDWKKSRKV